MDGRISGFRLRPGLAGMPLGSKRSRSRPGQENPSIFLRQGSRKRGWTRKSWTTQKAKPHVGKPFDRPALMRLLTNVLYLGEVNHKPVLWNREGKAQSTWSHPAGSAETWRPAETACTCLHEPRGTRRYRYYVCANPRSGHFYLADNRTFLFGDDSVSM